MHKPCICTYSELIDFALNERHPTAFNFARFVEAKSEAKYTVTEKQFILDLLAAFADQATALSNLHSEFERKWREIKY